MCACVNPGVCDAIVHILSIHQILIYHSERACVCACKSVKKHIAKYELLMILLLRCLMT